MTHTHKGSHIVLTKTVWGKMLSEVTNGSSGLTSEWSDSLSDAPVRPRQSPALHSICDAVCVCGLILAILQSHCSKEQQMKGYFSGCVFHLGCFSVKCFIFWNVYPHPTPNDRTMSTAQCREVRARICSVFGHMGNPRWGHTEVKPTKQWI